MKVSSVISFLSEYGPDEDIRIEWFDRNDFEQHVGKPVEAEAWSFVVARAEKFSESVGQALFGDLLHEFRDLTSVVVGE